ncbi:mitogen-activated protein kinase kinase kinase 2-like [Durio zibethinus]|uniref:Mitogen-activated protein kinase kinase kinase 2-like n=1 Tax=Durio zibethinus TaxID=66656 RepID=A0A6P6AYW8_DURZI|nr:mitogen-activated protein kinase kinase kinase 2-like [Durio zibethinus]
MLSIDQGMLVYNLFLEYAPGGSLLDLMIEKYGGYIPECEAKCYARMLLEGVRDIQQRGCVHCALKPANILVYPPDQYGSINSLKIADFGLARLPGDRDMAEVGTFPGTPVYMPPETVFDGKISAALDIWSLGCIVLEMITGKTTMGISGPEAFGDQDCIFEISTKKTQTMSSTGKDLLMKCFARDPSERWTADMLLSHPFTLPEYPLWPSPTKSLHHAQVDSCPPSMVELDDVCLAIF